MNVIEFIPGLGNYFLHKRLADDKNMSFEEKAYQASAGSAYNAGFTVYTMNRNIMAANKARYTTLSAPVVTVAVLFASATAAAPNIASRQYQSAITGQPSGTDSRLVFNTGEGLDYFRF